MDNQINTKPGILGKIYICWLIVSILIAFMAGKWSNDNITHIIIILFLILSFLSFKFFKIQNPKSFFIKSTLFLAALCEGAYMISKPVLPSLLITSDSTITTFIKNYAIDLIFTLPAYLFIFYVIWFLINKYEYSRWEYIFLFALGQALGDGSSFFYLNPLLLILIPFIMLNYHAMNVAPYLKIEKYLQAKNRSKSKWKYPAAIIFVWGSYFLTGTLIQMFAKFLY